MRDGWAHSPVLHCLSVLPRFHMVSHYACQYLRKDIDEGLKTSCVCAAYLCFFPCGSPVLLPAVPHFIIVTYGGHSEDNECVTGTWTKTRIMPPWLNRSVHL